MRMMMRAHIPVEAGNRAIQDGTIKKTIEETMNQLQPEAAYFLAENGKRTAYFFFDLKDASQIPPAGEPLFLDMNAEVDLIPVMNAEELAKGLEDLAKAR